MKKEKDLFDTDTMDQSGQAAQILERMRTARAGNNDLENPENNSNTPQTILETQDATQTNGVEGSFSQRITNKDAESAMTILLKYKAGKTALEERLRENDQWWRIHNWDVIGAPENKTDPTLASAWLFNSIANKHADAMDNYPCPNILPRASDDQADAKLLSSVVPVLLEYNEYEEKYDRLWWKKLVGGSCCTGVFWNSDKLNGLGDVDIRVIDLMGLFWEPGISDIQDSANVFNCEKIDLEEASRRYPNIELKGQGGSPVISEYQHDDNIDDSLKCTVVDWYYKKSVGTKTVLHYCKFIEGQIIYASENDPEYADSGYYEHGLYPFVIDSCFPIEDSPCGFGYVDVMKDDQKYIDKLNSVILKNAVASARKRYFVRADPKLKTINEEEFADVSKDLVHVTGTLDERHVLPIETGNLPGYVLNVLNQKIDELKETSGNRDFSQGATSAGVTSGSAIAALQEAGNKLSRDQIKTSYRAFNKTVALIIELIRQFYTEPRTFRITGEDGEVSFINYDNSNIVPMQGESEFGMPTAERKPIFDIKISAQKASTFSREVENERAKELFAMGFFNPQLADQSLCALDMMDFETKDKLRERISQNGTLMQQVAELQAQVIQLASIVSALNGSKLEAPESSPGSATVPVSDSEKNTVTAGDLGEAKDMKNRSAAEKMRDKVRNGANVND